MIDNRPQLKKHKETSMRYKPHKLHPVGDSPPQPPTRRLLPEDDEILKRARADAERLSRAVIEDLRRLREGRLGQKDG